MSEQTTLHMRSDQWADLAKIYKSKFSETGEPAQKALLEQANSLLPFTKATGVLDNGCGPAPVMSRLINEYKLPESCALTCADFSDGMIQEVRKTKDEEVKADSKSPWSRMAIYQNDALDLKDISDGSQSHVTAGFVYFMTQDPQKALSESKRVLKDGGVLGCSAWQGSQWLDLMNVLGKVRPDMKLPVLPPEWSDADKMRGELDRAGFKDTVTKKADAYMKYESRDSIVDFICKTMPHMVALMKDMSDEEKSKVKSSMGEELEKICGSEEPGIMHGVALVAAGRK